MITQFSAAKSSHTLHTLSLESITGCRFFDCSLSGQALFFCLLLKPNNRFSFVSITLLGRHPVALAADLLLSASQRCQRWGLLAMRSLFATLTPLLCRRLCHCRWRSFRPQFARKLDVCRCSWGLVSRSVSKIAPKPLLLEKLRLRLRGKCNVNCPCVSRKDSEGIDLRNIVKSRARTTQRKRCKDNNKKEMC